MKEICNVQTSNVYYYRKIYINVEFECSFFRVWRDIDMRNKVNYLKKKIEERTRIEKLICYLGLDYLFVGIVNRVMRPPTMSTIIILWNREFNYYKEQPLDSMMVKHELKSGTSSRTN